MRTGTWPKDPTSWVVSNSETLRPAGRVRTTPNDPSSGSFADRKMTLRRKFGSSNPGCATRIEPARLSEEEPNSRTPGRLDAGKKIASIGEALDDIPICNWRRGKHQFRRERKNRCDWPSME